jgi:hypothetical protein
MHWRAQTAVQQTGEMEGFLNRRGHVRYFFVHGILYQDGSVDATYGESRVSWAIRFVPESYLPSDEDEEEEEDESEEGVEGEEEGEYQQMLHHCWWEYQHTFCT